MPTARTAVAGVHFMLLAVCRFAQLPIGELVKKASLLPLLIKACTCHMLHRRFMPRSMQRRGRGCFGIGLFAHATCTYTCGALGRGP